jgi:hypothetical protein
LVLLKDLHNVVSQTGQPLLGLHIIDYLTLAYQWMSTANIAKAWNEGVYQVLFPRHLMFGNTAGRFH